MVSAIVIWLKNRLGILALERENVQLAKALSAQAKEISEANRLFGNRDKIMDDQEARIDFLEKQLTAKATTAKIVPKPHKVTTRQFLEAASKATEDKEESNG